MENHIKQENSKSSNRENVLLLSMSTLPGSPRTYHYQMETAERLYDFEGCTQLENGTKYILSKLSFEGKKLDRIVIMATKETRAALKEDVSVKWGTSCSALEIYESRVTDYINRVPYRIEGDKKNIPIEETQIDEGVSYTKEDLDKLFQIVDTDDTNQSTYFWNVVQKIKGEQEEKNGIDLYLDMQGGDRSAIAQINAVVQLLKDQNVNIKERIAIQFNREQALQEMKEVSEQYEIYDLITAMQAFKFYASGDELEKYFDTYGRKAESQDEKKKSWSLQLAATIQKISEAIRLCDMDAFDKELLEFKKLSEERHKNLHQEAESAKQDVNKTPMDIIFEDIYRDYEKILPSSSSGNQRQGNYIEKIRWCVKKGFIQQALTIVESQMPTVILNSGKLLFNWKQKVNCKNTDSKDSNKGKCLCLEEVIQACKLDWENSNNALLQKWANKNVVDSKKEGNEWVYVHLPLENLDQEWNSGRKEKLKKNGALHLKWKEEDKKTYECNIQLNIRFPKTSDKFIRFIKLHMALKEQRNKINHASLGEKRVPVKVLEQALMTYAAWAEELGIR